VYAIVKSGGKQYKVSEGAIVKVEKLFAEPGERVILDQVLLIQSDEGVKIGTPLLADAKVTAKVVEQGKDKKIVVFKYKKRKNYRRKQGHRQAYTRIKIETIEG